MTPRNLKTILDDHAKWLRNEGGARARLDGANLIGINLAGAFLADADLTCANLTRADLTGAYLAGANLNGACLTQAYMADANLAGADLAGAILADATLTRAYMADANLAGADLAGADLTGAYLTDAHSTGAPAVADLDGKLLAAIEAGNALGMGPWRAGWAVALAGDGGKALEGRYGSAAAGALIYAESYPDLPVPDFYCDNETALANIRWRAAIAQAEGRS